MTLSQAGVDLTVAGEVGGVEPAAVRFGADELYGMGGWRGRERVGKRGIGGCGGCGGGGGGRDERGGDDVEEEDGTFADGEEEADRGGTFFDMLVCRSDVVFHTTDSLTTHDLSTDQAQYRIAEFLAGGWAISAIGFFHENIKIFW